MDKKNYHLRGFTLVEVLVGVSLALIVFSGIFGAYQLGLKVIVQSRNKIVATAIANGEIEKIRNLAYESVGVVNAFPSGTLLASSTKRQNNIDYTIARRVDYVVDSLDGLVSPADECPNDYKRVEIKVSWSGRFSGTISLTTDVMPASLAEECSATGGILQVSVFDATGAMVTSPLIEVKNPVSGETIKDALPVSGKHYFSLAPATYKVIVSKPGYSTERTYGSDEIANPKNPHSIVLEKQLTPLSLAIDRLSSFMVTTLSSWGSESFKDPFLDQSQIFQISNLSVAAGQVALIKTNGEYQSSGYLISNTIEPTDMISWTELSFSDSEPTGTQILYHLLYLEGTDWLLLPDRDLPGNQAGFEVSPVSLKNLNPLTYPKLRVRADFSTPDLSLTPTLFDWQVSWKTSQATAIPGAAFHLRGAKTIGQTASEEEVFKYSQDYLSGADGQITIPGLEWDNYYFSVDPASGLSLIATDPETQPISLAPNASSQVKLYLKAQTSFLLTVENSLTLEPVFAAEIKLSNVQLGYNATLYTDGKGQAYFAPLQPATYDLDVQGPGYSPLTTPVSVSGDQTEVVKLEQIE